MSDLQGRRIPGEEGSGRRRPIIWILLGLLLLLLLALLIPFACQALQDPGGGSGAQGGEENASAQANQDGDGKAGDGKEGNAKAGGTDGGAGDGGAAGEGTNAAGRGRDAGATGEGADAEVANADVSGGRVSADIAAVPDQSGNGEAVTVPDAAIEGTRGWLVVHADDGGQPGDILGHARLREGTNKDVRVELDRPVRSSQKLYAMVHAEDPADGEYTFPDGDPPVMRDGEIALEPLSYTVSGATNAAAANGGDPGEQAGIRGGELPESGGLSPAALLAAGVALTLSLAWGAARLAASPPRR